GVMRMSQLTIKTNNVPRNLIYGYELSAAERKEFDYIPAYEIDSHDFFRYRGNIYDPSEFMRIPSGMFAPKWHAYASDTFFSGILIKYVNEFEQVVCATYFS